MSSNRSKVKLDSADLQTAARCVSSGRYSTAARICEKRLEHEPKNHEALYYLSVATLRQGNPDKALGMIDAALSSHPGCSKLHNAKGAILRKLGRLEDSEGSFRKAIELDCDSAEAYDNLGLVLNQRGNSEAALEMHRAAVQLSPKSGVFRLHLGQTLERLQDKQRAHGQFRCAAFLDPRLAEAYNGVGRMLFGNGAVQGAVDFYRQAIKAEPRLASAHGNLGIALRQLNQFQGSIKHFRAALRYGLDPVVGYNNLGLAYFKAERGEDAVRAFRSAIAAAPGSFDAHFNLANTLQDLGRVQPAIRAYRRALALAPDHRQARSNLLFLLSANVVLSRTKMLRELRTWEHYCCGSTVTRYYDHGRNRPRHRKLRIGYVSPDLRLHVVRQFFEAVLAYHDRSRFEVYCYAEVANPDFATRRLRQMTDSWFTTVGVSDGELAHRIRSDGIDILVDLAGHTARNRLGVFCYRPAPIQATHLGYFASTGLSAIDYWITDWVLHPADTKEPAVETIFRLPRCAFGYGIPAGSPPVNPGKSGTGPLTFGYVNNLAKATRPAVDRWCEVLRACPDARLLMRDNRFRDAKTRRRWRRRFETRGVDPGRVDLLEKARHHRYLASLNEIDIALDPFPRTGGTTTADCLWMGVPVVTLAGGRYVERLSATKLAAVGLEELIAATPENYVSIAVNLAMNAGRRREIRVGLRDRMKHSPLCDTRGLAQSLEAGYKEMWSRYLGKT